MLKDIILFSYKMVFRWIIFIVIFYEVNTIQFSVFDSPPAIRNILLTGKSLNDILKYIRSRKTTDVTLLGHGIDKSAKRNRWSIINPVNYYLKKDSLSNVLSNRLMLDYNIRNQISNSFVLKDYNRNILSGAAYGLSLIQHIYNLDVSAMANGSVTVLKNDMAEKIGPRGEKLSGIDFIILAFFAIKVSWYQNAAMYLKIASEYIPDGVSSSISSYSVTYTSIIDKLNYIAESGLLLQQQNEEFEFESRFLPFSTLRQKKDIESQTRIKANDNAINKSLKYNDLIKNVCNGNYRAPNTLPGEAEVPEMKCRLMHNNNPYLRLGPFMFEIKRRFPFRAVIHDILSSYELDRITKGLLPQLTYEKSESLLIYNDSPAETYEDHYKASTLYFNGLETDPSVMKTISRKVQLATYLIFNDDGRRGKFKGTLYGLGAMTEEHNDAYGVENFVKMSEEYRQYFEHAGDIIATVMFWLCDTALGGGTYFCSKNAEDVVLPKKGSAVVWTSLKASGFRNDLQQHGGCPVGLGQKFIITQWFNQYFQHEKFPCDIKKSAMLNMYSSLHSIGNTT